jgi:hypothetical protein
MTKKRKMKIFGLPSRVNQAGMEDSKVARKEQYDSQSPIGDLILAGQLAKDCDCLHYAITGNSYDLPYC